MAVLDFPDSTQSPFEAPNGVTYIWNNQGFWEAEGSDGYVLPIASDIVLGGIKVGSRLTISGDGTLSADIQGGGGTTVGNLQEVTDEGNTTTNGATFNDTVFIFDSVASTYTGLYKEGSVVVNTDEADSSTFVWRHRYGGDNPSAIMADGSASFSGIVQVRTSDNEFAQIEPYGVIKPKTDQGAMASAAAVQISYDGGTDINLNYDGSAEFAGLVGTQGLYAGDIANGPYAYLTTSGTVDLWPSGAYVLTGRNTSGTVTSQISGDGGASFSEGRVTINSPTNGDAGQEYFKVTDATNSIIFSRNCKLGHRY